MSTSKTPCFCRAKDKVFKIAKISVIKQMQNKFMTHQHVTRISASFVSIQFMSIVSNSSR